MLVDSVRHAYYHLPQPLQRAVLVRRRGPIWLRAGIVFVHIPKAAGTSISEALYGRFVGHVRAADVVQWGPSRLKALPRFAITRNPWDRLVSAYRFVTRGGGVGGAHAGRVWRAEQYRISEFQSFDRFVTDGSPRATYALSMLHSSRNRHSSATGGAQSSLIGSAAMRTSRAASLPFANWVPRFRRCRIRTDPAIASIIGIFTRRISSS